MEILDHGNPDRVSAKLEGTCQACGCNLRCDRDEAKWQYDNYSINCPTCSGTILLDYETVKPNQEFLAKVRVRSMAFPLLELLAQFLQELDAGQISQETIEMARIAVELAERKDP